MYYRMRGLNKSEIYPDYSHGWEKCDCEMLAEDYRYYFSPYMSHEMANDVGNPTREVQEYIRWLMKPQFA